MSSANLEGARFEKTKHDAKTLFPEGFEFPVKPAKGQAPTLRPSGLEVASRVGVTFGVFAGMEGEVKEILEATGMVRVELVIIGHPMQIDLEYEDVEQT